MLMLMAALPAAANAGDFKSGQARHVQIRLVPEHNRIAAGETVTVAIEQTIDAGWHTYWVNAGDSGQPPEITWTLPKGFRAGPIQWPVPEKIIAAGLGTYGYEKHVVLLQDITAPKTLPDGPIKISASVEILVCKEICIPEEGSYSLTLNAGNAAGISTLAEAARSKLPMGVVTDATFGEDNGTFILTLPKPDDAAAKPAVALFPADWGMVDNPAKAIADFKSDPATIKQKRGDRPLTTLKKATLLVSYKTVRGDVRAVTVEAKPGKFIVAAPPSAPEVVKAEPAAAPQEIPPASEAAPQSAMAGCEMCVFQAIIFAILGGLILNLMPCVFPILSLKTLKLCKLSGSEVREAQTHAILYTAGILVSFGVLAIMLIVLRGAGQQIGWGFQLQNPAFVLPLSWLLFVIGLNLSGFFEFGGSLANAGHRLTEGHSFAASFFTGVLAAVVATPCTAPFMGVALGFALTQPAPVTLIVLLSLGFGLALPFLLVTFSPALREKLPRPGAWMQTFREFLAFPMYASAAWLAWVFSLQAGPMSVMAALSGAVAIAFALWLLNKAPDEGAGRGLMQLLALAFLIGAGAMVPYAAKMQVQTAAVMAVEEWAPYVAADFAKLEKGNDPIFVDMTAAWCITCKVNENAVLNTAAIKDLFSSHRVQTVKGDWTNRNPEITEFLAKFGRNGVPIYVYYGPRDKKTGQRPEPVVLPQILTPGIVERTVEGK